MKLSYEVDGWMKDAEVDMFEEGCQPGTGACVCGSERFAADTVAGLIDKLVEFCDVEKSAVSLDACDDPGRVDIQALETAEGVTAGPMDIQRWKQGTAKLWLASYMFTIQKVTREDVDLEGVTV